MDRVVEYAEKELEKNGGDPAQLDIPLQTVAVLYPVQTIIDNGGFRYLFENDFPFTPPYSLFSDAYRRIGAMEVAERLDRAVAMFPFPNPHLAHDRRNEFMDSLDESHEFFELGDQVCGDEGIWVALERYATQHAASFRIM